MTENQPEGADQEQAASGGFEIQRNPYPDTRAAVDVLISESEHDGQTVMTYYSLLTDYEDNLPAALIYSSGGTEGDYDRVDRISVDVFAEGTMAVDVSESIKSVLSGVGGKSHDIPGVGVIDRITCETTPHDVPYPSDRINMAQAVYRVTVRPIYY